MKIGSAFHSAKERDLTLYQAFGGVAIQKRIVTFFFLWRKFQSELLFTYEKARSPPLRFDFKKYNEHQFPNSDVVEINLATMCSG